MDSRPHLPEEDDPSEAADLPEVVDLPEHDRPEFDDLPEEDDAPDGFRATRAAFPSALASFVVLTLVLLTAVVLG
jgi:hypothetical protein